jgi:hypothetical protein
MKKALEGCGFWVMQLWNRCMARVVVSSVWGTDEEAAERNLPLVGKTDLGDQRRKSKLPETIPQGLKSAVCNQAFAARDQEGTPAVPFQSTTFTTGCWRPWSLNFMALFAGTIDRDH